MDNFDLLGPLFLIVSVCILGLLTISSRKKARIRHVLHLGKKMEKQAESFYRKLAKQTRSDVVKKLCLKLADEERDHLKLIEDKLSRWRPLPISQKILSILDTDASFRELFLNPPNKNASTDEFVEYAMDQEKKMVLFYSRFEGQFTHTWKIHRLDEMIEEEKEHVAVWTEILTNK